MVLETGVDALESTSRQVRSLETSVELDSDNRVDLFKDQLNIGLLQPVIVDINPDTTEAIVEFESKIDIDPVTSVQGSVHQVERLFERFTPGMSAENRKSSSYQAAFGDFVAQRGLDPDVPLKDQLARSGRRLYLPSGVDAHGHVRYARADYLPEPIQYEILTASEWRLLSPEARERLKNSRLTAIGLSVGSHHVFQGLISGITDFTIADPGTLHADAQSRLGDDAYDKSMEGVNKAVITLRSILRRYPYARVRAFPAGLTEENAAEIFAQDPLQPGGMWFISEEADKFEAKRLSREMLQSILYNPHFSDTDVHLIMSGDVGQRVSFFHETRGSRPFQGYMEVLHPGDPYGKELEAMGDLLPLFASVGGFDGIPLVLLKMMAHGEIGQSAGAQITRVPQSPEATALASALFARAIRLCAEGVPLVNHRVVDLTEALTDQDLTESEAVEQQMQTAMNQGIFQIPHF